MKKPLFISLMLCGTGVWAPSAAYDPMEDLVSTAKQEINAKDAIETAKQGTLNGPKHKKVTQGFWQFFQGKQGAKPGEYCTAVFWKGNRMISIVGPGGSYQGALLNFIAIEPPEGFPRPDDAKVIDKVKVTLKQGRDAPATLTAFNRSIGGFADEIAFAVPTIDAALAGMEDQLAFTIDHAGKQIFALEWHSGLAAGQMLRKCLKGERVDGREVP